MGVSEQNVKVFEGDSMSYTVPMEDGRKLLLNVRVLSVKYGRAELGVSASITVPQPDVIIELVPA